MDNQELQVLKDRVAHLEQVIDLKQKIHDLERKLDALERQRSWPYQNPWYVGTTPVPCGPNFTVTCSDVMTTGNVAVFGNALAKTN